MLFLQGQYKFSIRVEETQVEDLSGFNSLKITESAMAGLPLFELIIADDYSFIEGYGVGDGTRISFSLEPLTSPEEEDHFIPFRVFSVKANLATYGNIIKLTGYYDAPKYLTQAMFNYYDGPSSLVAERLASQVDLTSQVDRTRDNQVWISPGLTGYKFLQAVTRHAFLDRKSAFVSCVTREGLLKFLDIGNRRHDEPTWNFFSTDFLGEFSNASDANEIRVENYSIEINSGFFNRWGGYGNLYSEFDIITGGKNLPDSLRLESVEKSTDKLEVNRDLNYPPRYKALPVNIGNVHENYSRAKVQNERILSLFSTTVKAVSRDLSDVQLLDRVQCLLRSKEGSTIVDSINGDYYVNDIVTHVTSNSFFSLFRLVREGSNNLDTLTDKL